MADIFLSYARSDAAQANELIDHLRTKGITVWSDTQGLKGAEQWATEIAGSIRECDTFLVMLSDTSVASDHVLKEVSLASEKRKRIVPVDVAGSIELPVSFEYALAGIQRVAYGNFDAVLEAIKSGSKRSTVTKDSRKSLMILPFEDLSPTRDNEWFADGLMSELIDMLSTIKSLRLIDQKTSREYKGVAATTMEISRELNVRYFIEGNVRKFGDQIKISMQLLDVQEGEYLWTNSHRGEFKDIFDIQEEVARKVVEGLKLKLTGEEERKLEERGTESVEAYELYLKGMDYADRMTKAGYEHAVHLFESALKLDPGFSRALSRKGFALLGIFRSYDRQIAHVLEAERVLLESIRLRPGHAEAYSLLSNAYRVQGRVKEAEEAALTGVEKAPNDWACQFGLGFFYMEDRPQLAIEPFERSVAAAPRELFPYFNLVMSSLRVGDMERVKKWSLAALPHYERRLRMQPDDELARVRYASLLQFAGDVPKALEILKPLQQKQGMDPGSLHNLGALYARLGDKVLAIDCLSRSVDAGFAYIESFNTNPDFDGLRDMPEFNEVVAKLTSKTAS